MTTIVHLRAVVAAACLAALVAGCSDEFETTAPLRATIVPAGTWPTSLDLGDTAIVEVRLTSPAYGNLRVPVVTWTSSDENVLRVLPIVPSGSNAAADSLDARRTRVRIVAVHTGSARVQAVTTATPALESVSMTADVSVKVVWKQVVGFINSTCGLSRRGFAFCWGATIGTLTRTHNPKPVSVGSPFSETTPRFRTLAAGDTHVCGDANVVRPVWFCWGENFNGQLTDGTTIPQIFPVPMNLNGVIASQLSVSDGATCALGPAYLRAALNELTDIYCWGVGFFATQAKEAPDIIYSIEPAGDFRGGHWGCDVGPACPAYYAVNVGTAHACALYHGTSSRGARDSVVCWGSNRYGQLGLPTTTASRLAADTVFSRAVPAGRTHAMTALMTSFAATCVIASAELLCWGDAFGVVPMQPFPGTLFIAVHGVRDGNLVCAVSVDGKPYCIDTLSLERTTPTDLAADGRRLRLTSIMVAGKVIGGQSFRHACGITEGDGALYCWGVNTYGQLGRDTGGAFVTAPVRVIDP